MPAAKAAKRRVSLTAPPRPVNTTKLPPQAQKPAPDLSGKGPPTPPHVMGVGGPYLLGTAKNEENKAGVNALLQQAAGLSKKDQRFLLDQLALATQVVSKPDERELQLWAHAVTKALQTVTAAEVSGYGPVLVRRALGTREAWQTVSELVADIGFSSLTVTERGNAYHLLAGLLVQHASAVSKRSGAPLVLKLVVACVPNLRAVVDNEFPGYLAAGLALMPFRMYVKRGFTTPSTGV